MKREDFIQLKFKEWKKLLEKHLPKQASKFTFEDILNLIKELLC